MATIEERLTAIEHDHAELKHDNTELKHANAELKQKVELQTIAIGGLVNKALLESINEKNDKIFKALMDHDEFTNQQLAELREKVEVQIEGKIVGMQTEMRQRFEQQDKQIAVFREQMTDVRSDLTTQGQKLDQILLLLTTSAPQSERENL